MPSKKKVVKSPVKKAAKKVAKKNVKKPPLKQKALGTKWTEGAHASGDATIDHLVHGLLVRNRTQCIVEAQSNNATQVTLYVGVLSIVDGDGDTVFENFPLKEMVGYGK